jgi:NAD-dependent dihydropyrimidine dehydrogenase PreA subunit
MLNYIKEPFMVDKKVDVDFDLPAMEVVEHLCKGCGLCIKHCPQKVIKPSGKFNELGYNYSTYKGLGCSGCGICFYMCPEPGAIKVYKKVKGE